MKPREVDLPCCEICRRVGKLPADASGRKDICTGPQGSPHARTPMVARTFMEVLEEKSRAPG